MDQVIREGLWEEVTNAQQRPEWREMHEGFEEHPS